MGKEVRIYTFFSNASHGCCRVRSLVPLFISLWMYLSFVQSGIRERGTSKHKFFSNVLDRLTRRQARHSKVLQQTEEGLSLKERDFKKSI